MADTSWILVKHWHDQGGIKAAYGPYSKEQAEWLAAEIGADSYDATTVTQLKTLPGMPPAVPPKRDLASTTNAQLDLGPRAQPWRRSARPVRPAPPFGFGPPEVTA